VGADVRCNHCGRPDEYIIHDDLWAAVARCGERLLCLACGGDRRGRELTFDDFWRCSRDCTLRQTGCCSVPPASSEWLRHADELHAAHQARLEEVEARRQNWVQLNLFR
jgi:hypothetical protein